eukprot:gene18242-21827_t
MKLDIYYQLIPLFFALLAISPSLQYGESTDNGFPTYVERESHVLTNAVRLDPTGYMTKYFPDKQTVPMLTPAKYPVAPPLYWDETTMNMARAHSVDMSSHNYFGHPDFNGTTVQNRLFGWQQKPCIRGFGENIQAGADTGLKANNLLLCEKYPTTLCTADGVGDGHRVNIMKQSYVAMGIALSTMPKTVYTQYWTMDFLTSTCIKETSKVHSGSHTFVAPTKPIYMASWYFGSPPTSAKIFIKSKAKTASFDLTLNLGTKQQGIYSYQPATFEECQPYYYVFTLGKDVTRYPTTGSLNTATKDSKCPSWTKLEFK